ncbi:MAG: dipeptidase [Rhodobacteraceae bacterium]|nr:dipeptidase [Paracoccaceae bacterium]
MRPTARLFTASVLALIAGPAISQTALSDADVMAIHDRLLTIDSHVDIGSGYGTKRLDPGVINDAQVDLPSMRIGGLDAGFFVVYTPQGALTEEGYAGAALAAEEGYRGILRMLRANPHQIGLATTADEVEALNADGKLVALIGIENAYPLGSTPEEVAEAMTLWANRGATYVSLTHFGHNQFGGSSNPSSARGEGEDPGLTELGRALIESLNRNGVMVDVSHVGPQTTADAIAASRVPVIASHSTVAAVHDNPRGLTDAQLEAIRDSGGVAQITAFRSYIAELDPQVVAATGILRDRLGLNSGADFRAASPETLAEYRREIARIRETFEDVTLAQYLDHVDHAVQVAGIDHVGLSGDFDGGGGVAGWDNAADSPNVTAALLERGYSVEDLAKIWGGNLLRVLREVQAHTTQ